MGVIIPEWFDRLDLRDPDDRRLRNKYLVRVAALVHNPHGSHTELAEALGLSTVSLYHAHSARSGGIISPRLALALERVLGPDVMPVKLTRPDLCK